MKLRNILAGSLIILSAAPAFSQLEGSVTVEGEYAPIIIESERLNITPKGFKFELPPASVDYDFTGIVTDFRPGLLSMGATGRHTGWPWKKRRGFVDLSMGSWLDTDLHAGVAILSDSVNTLNAKLDFTSSSLYRTKGVPESFTRPSLKRLYDGALGLHYSRLLGREGLLQADAGYSLGYFNYYGTTVARDLLPQGAEGVSIPTQTVNRAFASVGFASSPSTIRGWHAEAGVNFLGYRRLYGPAILDESISGDRETHLEVGGGYKFNFADFNAISLDAKGDFLFYSKAKEAPEGWGVASKSRNYGVVALRPSYRFAKDALSLRAGLDLAVGYDAMGYDPDAAKFYVAPDIAVEYQIPAGVGLFLTATGGVTPATLQLKEQFDRYQMPYVLWTEPIYTPVDTKFGTNFGPFAGFSGSFAFRYAISKNVPLGGWYQQYLGAYPVADPLLRLYATTPARQSVNLNGFGLDLALRYSYGNLVDVQFAGTYVPQSGEDGIFNGYDRPRWTLSAIAGVRPIKKLEIQLGYDYKGVRNCYAWGEQPFPGIQPPLEAYRLADITDLNARVAYKILDNLEIYCKGENLLNRHVELLPGLQSEGIVVMGGFYWEF